MLERVAVEMLQLAKSRTLMHIRHQVIVHLETTRMRAEQNKTSATHPEVSQLCERLDAIERRQLVVVDLQ